jgi:hypothetical protein
MTVLSCLSFMLVVTSCGQSGPSERDAQTIVERSFISGDKIVTFNKTNGQEIDGFGGKAYRMFYEATVEFTCDTKAGCAANGRHYSLGEIGQYRKTGRVIFEKSEQGWVNGRIESDN